MEGKVSAVTFPYVSTLTLNYKSCNFFPLLNSILGDQQMTCREVEEEVWNGLLLFSIWMHRCELMALHTMAGTAELVQLEDSSRLLFPGSRPGKKKKNRKERKTENSASSCPSSSPGGSAYIASPSWPTKLLGLGCTWAQSTMLFKQTSNLRCLWPFYVPARYINRSQVKPGCLLANISKIKACVLSVVNKLTCTRGLFSLKDSKARSVVWGEETAT